MSAEAPDDSADQQADLTPDELVAALVENFLEGTNEEGDALVAGLREWQRQKGRPRLPYRGEFAGTLFPPPLEPVRAETNPVILRRVLAGLRALPVEDAGDT